MRPKTDGPQKVTIIRGDLRQAELPQVDYVVSNPPYFKAGSGNPSPNALKDAARFERHGTIADFVGAALRAVRTGGNAGFVMRYERRDDLILAIDQASASIRFGSMRMPTQQQGSL